jgi:predicted enzyme related to lactoylglutathione lyase
MGKRTEYAPGTFCWVDLSTTDAAAAKGFYGELFGWDTEDAPVGEAPYTLLRLDGDSIGGLIELTAEMRERGVPPNWLSHVSVDDADSVADKARELGGTVQVGPMDIADSGRTAVVQDPTGAMFGVWQPRENIGATRVNDVGCLTWNQLTTNDVDRALEFYRGLFGWETSEIDTGGGPRVVNIRNAGRMNGGAMPLQPDQESVPPHWLPYFTVPSADAAKAKVEQLGGRTYVGPMDVPAGRFAVFADPQGAAFAVFEGETEP